MVSLLGVILTVAVGVWRAHAPRWLAHDLQREVRTNEFVLTQIREEVELHILQIEAPRWQQERVKRAITMPWPQTEGKIMHLGHVMESVAAMCSSTKDGFWNWNRSTWLASIFPAFNGVHPLERKKPRGSKEAFENPLVLLEPVKLKENLMAHTGLSQS